MKAAINHVMQLQELILIREEKRVLTGTHHLEQLNESIKELTANLPASVHEIYTKLAKKDHIAITPIAEGYCAVCRMQLPVSLVQAVRQLKQLQCCPNCARMLYYPETPVRRFAAKTRRTDPEKVGITRFSAQSLMIPKLVSNTKEGAIGELAMLMESGGFVDKAVLLVERALEREEITSTALEHGLAFPHVRAVEGGGLALALGLSQKGIEWDKGITTKIVIFVVIPTGASAFYLKLIAGLAETFSKAEARKALMVENDPEKLWKTLVKVTRSTIK